MQPNPNLSLNLKPITIDHRKVKTRILRPVEWEAFVGAVPKQRLKTICKVALLTGMRWVELEELLKHPGWFDGEFIEVPARKRLRTYNKRWVRLSTLGKELLPFFFQLGGKQGSSNAELPSWQAMSRNMKRWASRAGLDPTGLSVKTFRKTYESWLVFSFPHLESLVAESQGHTLITSVKHYRRLPFTSKDREQIKPYTQGWDS